MNKQEFLNELEKINCKFFGSDEDYKTIEYVYTFHPSIDETDGKRQIAFLYATFGMRIIEDKGIERRYRAS